MEVNTRSVLPSSSYTVNNTAAVNVGDTTSMLIKERTGNNQAKVILKGQEQTVQFDGPVPSENLVYVEITKKSDIGQLVVKPIVNPPASKTTQPVDAVLKKVGFNPKTDIDLKEAAKQVLSRGGAVSKETLQNLKDFLANDPGSLKEKLDTITVMQQKNLEFTKVQLYSVNAALHGPSFTESVKDLAGGSLETSGNTVSPKASSGSDLAQVISQLKNDTSRAVAIEQVLSSLDPKKDAQTISAIQKALQIQEAGKDRIINALPTSDLKQAVQEEPSLLAMIHLLKTKEPNLSITTAIQEAQQLEKIGNDRLEAAVRKIFNNSEKSNSVIEELVGQTSSLSDEGSYGFLQNKASLQASDSKAALDRIIAEVRNETSRTAAIERILSTLDSVKDAEPIADIQKALQIQQAGKDRIINALPTSDLKQAVQEEPSLSAMIQLLKTREPNSGITTAIQEAQQLEKIGNDRLEAAVREIFTTSENEEAPTVSVLQDITNVIQKEPSMQKVLSGIQTLLEKNPDPDLDFSTLSAAYEKAAILNGQGKELAARKELSNAISQLQDNNPHPQNKNDTAGLSKLDQYIINEAIQTLQLDSKNILVTQITKKLSQLAIDFKQMRQEVSRNLDSVSRALDGNKAAASVVPAKQMLDASINKLDQAILKSDFMLYADMSTEKKMLSASSRLAEARNLLNKGNFTEASQIVKEVKNVVDQLIFKPSDNRIKHFIAEQDLLSPKSLLEQTIPPGRESGARNTFETVKMLGLTHEVDSANALIRNHETPHNLKSMLIQMLETDNGQSKLPIEQTLANLTGQQLLNKQDPSGMQNLFVQLPILLNNQVENVNVYVNSQKKGEKIDWENCSLYFVLETKKLGDIGISISAVNRNLSITFKNNQEALPDLVKSLTDGMKERLQDTGYQVGAIQFKPLSAEEETGESAGEKKGAYPAVFTVKGYDFTI